MTSAGITASTSLTPAARVRLCLQVPDDRRTDRRLFPIINKTFDRPFVDLDIN